MFYVYLVVLMSHYFQWVSVSSGQLFYITRRISFILWVYLVVLMSHYFQWVSVFSGQLFYITRRVSFILWFDSFLPTMFIFIARRLDLLFPNLTCQVSGGFLTYCTVIWCLMLLCLKRVPNLIWCLMLLCFSQVSYLIWCLMLLFFRRLNLVSDVILLQAGF